MGASQKVRKRFEVRYRKTAKPTKLKKRLEQQFSTEQTTVQNRTKDTGNVPRKLAMRFIKLTRNKGILLLTLLHED